MINFTSIENTIFSHYLLSRFLPMCSSALRFCCYLQLSHFLLLLWLVLVLVPQSLVMCCYLFSFRYRHTKHRSPVFVFFHLPVFMSCTKCCSFELFLSIPQSVPNRHRGEKKPNRNTIHHNTIQYNHQLVQLP